MRRSENDVDMKEKGEFAEAFKLPEEEAINERDYKLERFETHREIEIYTEMEEEKIYT